MKYLSISPEETRKIAKEFSSKLVGGEVIAMTGDLGAGKTCFVQGLAEGLGVPWKVYVRSPSFTLINEYYGGRLPLFHIDFYRLTDGADLDTLGLDEYIYGSGIAAVEWADRFPELIPHSAFQIKFRTVDDETREIIIDYGPLTMDLLGENERL